MQRNACKVCGGSDMNLVDGFYYCVECGTQDENIQERVVETEIFIGLHTKNAKSKIQNVQEKMNLGPEWCKWHAYNFIIAGLTDELIAAGAQPSVKLKVLWIWTRYMKFFKAKNDRPKSQFFGNDEESQEACNEKEHHNDNNVKLDDNDGDDKYFKNHDSDDDDNDNLGENDDELDKKHSCDENDTNDSDYNDDKDSHDDKNEKLDKNSDDLESNYSEDDKYADRKERMKSLIKHVSKGVIIAIFYIALNLDRSDIQLSHLLRFVRWRYVDISTCTKYIPKDLDVTGIPRFSIFRMTIQKLYKPHTIRQIALALMKFLNLGLPLVPNMRKLVDNYTKELCLPDDFKDLVLALMHQYPSRQTRLSKGILFSVTLPDYEAICLSYFVVAFKLCFGLDDDYEIKLSDVVDKMNSEKKLSKSYKIGAYSTTSGRMFSFREWCEYMKLRKMIVCKHNLRMARLHRLDVSDYVFLEHLDKIKTKSSSLASDIVKDMLNKIPIKTEMAVIPKDEFDLSFTPMSSYTDVILDYVQDPDLRLMLSEDYTQYSLDYAIKKLQLKENMDARNIVTGVTKNNKVVNKNISGHFSVSAGDDSKMIYIRFCEKKDGVSESLVKQITMESQCNNDDDLKIDGIENFNKESEKYNDTNTKQVATDINVIDEHENDKSKIEHEMSVILENDHRPITFVDYPNACIYDDDNKDDVKQAIATINESFGTINDNNDFYDYISSCLPNSDNKSDVGSDLPENVDRRTMINELIRHACVTYKISLPPPKKSKALSKKETDTVTTPAKTRKRQSVPADYRNGINMRKSESNMFMMLQTYYKNIQEQIRDNGNDIQEHSMFNESIQDNIEETSQHADSTKNADEPDPFNSTVDCEVQENDDDNEMEKFLDTDEDESDEDYILPETAQLNEDDISKLDKAADKILEKETNRCGMPPKKKVKLNESDKDKKINVKKAENQKVLHPSAWGVQHFNYWIRHYSLQTQLLRSRDVHDTFNLELFDNLPKAFAFVLQECGSVIDSTPFRLYRQMEFVEKHILLKLKHHNKKRKVKSKKPVKKK